MFPSDRSFLCGAGRNAVMIDPFGQLQLCGTYRVDAFDLRQGTVADGWRSLLEVIERPPERPSRCLPCDKRRLCGSCAGTNVLENGHRDEPSDYHCEITHARVEAFCADLRPEPSTARALPLHRARPCARPWLDERRPLLPGHLAILERRSRLRDVPPAQVAPPTRRLPLAAAR